MSEGVDRPEQSRLSSALQRLGMDSRARQSWVLFDFGDNAFATVVTVLLQTYFITVAGAGLPEGRALIYWSFTVALSYGIFAVLSPVLGAIADHLERSRAFLGSFTGLGVVATALLFFTGEGDWLAVAVLFLFANIGFSGARLFYNSLLTGIATEETMDRVSTAGYATGYLGGGLLLTAGAVVLATPETFGIADQAAASRLLLFVAACWWALFAIPLFVYVPEPDRDSSGAVQERPVRASFQRLRDTYRDIRTYRDAFLFLAGFFFYASGITAIINLAAAYASDIGLGQAAIIGALVMVQFVGIPCAFVFGQLAGRFSTKRMILVGLAVYTLVSIGGIGIQNAWQFFVLALGVALVQGGTQGLSRSLFGSLTPQHKSAEFFSFFAVVSAVSSIMAPTLFGLIGLVAGSNRVAIASLSLFFLVGAAIILRVDVEHGREVARERTESVETPTAVPTD
jgi:UMF1 family MFS transporter